MTLSFWRYAHLVLAIFSSLFLVLAAVTGTILAVDAIQEKIPSYQVSTFDKITLSETLPVLRKTYPEITAVSVDHNQFVLLEGIDQEGNDVNAYVDPTNGKILGKPTPKSEFIQWTTALHRSLFLKETGRFIVGFISLLLALIALSGLALIINRQRSIRSVFSKVAKFCKRKDFKLKREELSLTMSQLLLEGWVLAQASRQIPVKLDHRHLVHLGGDRFGQCRQTRADFHQVLTRLRVDGGDYLIDHITVVQEVLTETLTGRVAHVHLVALHLTAHIFFSLPSGWRG